MRPLKGGLKLEGRKEATLTPWSSARPSPPKRVRIPLVQNSGEEASPSVRDGQKVCVGEKIAETPHLKTHASLSGRVTLLRDAIEIQGDSREEALPEIGQERKGWESLGPEELRQILIDSGVEIHTPGETSVILLNGCESEPYVTSAHSLMMSHPVEILRAGEILLRAFEAEKLVIAIQDDKEEIVELFKSKIFFHSWSGARIEELPARYPQDDPGLLVPSLGLSPRETVVADMSRAFAAYEAVVLQKPFYERIVTIAGECVASPRNFWLRIGTLVEDAVKYARGFLREPERLILGGPMRGRAVETAALPILKETSAVLGLPREVAKPESVEPCIRCGRCLESCPVSISPAMITLAAEKDLFELAEDYGAARCIECGNCSYVCPAKRPMLELIQYANAL